MPHPATQAFDFRWDDVGAAAPFVLLVIFGVMGMLFEIVLPARERKAILYWTGVLGFLAALGAAVSSAGEPTRLLFAGAMRRDGLSTFLGAAILGMGFLSYLQAADFAIKRGVPLGGMTLLYLFGASGMLVMVGAHDLLVFFLGLEIMSLSVYILAALMREDPRSSEGALKYFLMGAVASGIFLFGLALLYGTTHTLSLGELAGALERGGVMANPLLVTGLALILVGLAFKVSAVPFHFWAPDAYAGAPTPVTGFLATAVKTAAFVGFLRIVVVGFGTLEAVWLPAIRGLALATMIVGNIVAMAQQDLKRLMAYSSIAHAGYLLVGVAAGSAFALPGRYFSADSVLFYLVAYALATLGIFGVLVWLARKDAEAWTLQDLAGLGYRFPWAGMTMSVCLLSLMGMPLTAGFAAKYGVFSAAIESGQWDLVVVGVATSLLSAWYYLRLVVFLYMRRQNTAAPPVEDPPEPSFSTGLSTAICLAGVLALGVFPGWLWSLAARAFRSLGA